MMIYYISAIDGDNCVLKTRARKVEKVLPIAELADFKETVVGYNRITGAVSLKTPDDVIKHIEAKMKLIGVKNKCIRIEEDPEMCGKVIRINKPSRVVQNGNICDVYIEDDVNGYDLTYVCDNLLISMDGIADCVLDSIDYTDISSVNVRLHYNVGSYLQVFGEGMDSTYAITMLEKDTYITDLIFENKDMFKRCENAKNVFISLPVLKSFVPDFTSLNFNPSITTFQFLGDSVTSAKFPKEFYKGTHQFLYCLIEMPLEQIVATNKEFNQTVCKDMRIPETTLSDVIENYQAVLHSVEYIRNLTLNNVDGLENIMISDHESFTIEDMDIDITFNLGITDTDIELCDFLYKTTDFIWHKYNSATAITKHIVEYLLRIDDPVLDEILTKKFANAPNGGVSNNIKNKYITKLKQLGENNTLKNFLVLLTKFDNSLISIRLKDSRDKYSENDLAFIGKFTGQRVF